MSVSERPNFILLQGEDAGRYLGCYGDPLARTFHLDQLAAQGCVFSNGFSTAPVCAPSRGTMVCGQYAWSLGNHHMRCMLTEPPRTFTEELRDAGYYVNWANKTDFNFEPREEFADDRCEWADMLREGRLPRDKPFFLYHNFIVTHESTMWQPDNEWWCAANERLENDWRLDPEDRPNPDEVRVPAYLADHPEIRHEITRFYEALAIMDKQAGELLEALEASGQAENTYVIYLTDHGRGLWREKRWPYDAGIHLSLVIRGPGIERGSVNEDLLSWVDLAPTILSLAGVPIPGHYQGQVFLGPQKAAPRSEVFAGRDRMGEVYDRVRVVREDRLHYCRNYYPHLPYAQRCWYMTHLATTGVMRELMAQDQLSWEQAQFLSDKRPPEELYDAETDPDMVHNLAEDPAYAADLERLRRKLDAHLAQVGDLAEKSERELIDEGIIEDHLETYYKRGVPLPERHAIGGHFRETIVERPAPAE